MKIVFFNKFPSYSLNGGLEKYNLNIYENINKEFIEYFTKKEFEDKKIDNVSYNKKQINDLNELINSKVFFTDELFKLRKLKKSFFENNNEIYFVDHGQGIKKLIVSRKWFSKLFRNLYIFLIRRKLKDINIITFTDEDKKLWNKYHSKIIVITPETSISLKEEFIDVSSEEKNGLIFIARVVKVKKPKLAIELAKKLNIDITFAGHGPLYDKNWTNYYDKVNMIGRITDEEEKINLIAKHKYLVITSKYEGFPQVILESFYANTPVAVLDNFPSARYLVGKNERGIISENIDSLIEKINSVSNDEYERMIENIKNFNLKENNFIKNWNKLF